MTLERIRGTLAQLGEHRPYKARVSGSSPLSPTIFTKKPAFMRAFLCLLENQANSKDYSPKLAPRSAVGTEARRTRRKNTQLTHAINYLFKKMCKLLNFPREQLATSN